MLKFQWNALRHGHRVNVHDPASPAMVLIRGTVVMTEAHVGRGGTAGVGIQVTDEDGTSRVVRPTYPSVHLDPVDPSDACWRCDEIAMLPAPRQAATGAR